MLILRRYLSDKDAAALDGAKTYRSRVPAKSSSCIIIRDVNIRQLIDKKQL